MTESGATDDQELDGFVHIVLLLPRQRIPDDTELVRLLDFPRHAPQSTATIRPAGSRAIQTSSLG